MQDNRERLLPLFWLKGEDEETLRKGVRDVCRSGCGALVAESRTHPDFLGPAWWRDLAILLDECEKHQMKLWVLDDQHFPSGYAAGRATGTLRRMMLTERHMDVMGPLKGAAFIARDDETAFEEGEGVVAVVAARRLEGGNWTAAFEDIGGYALGEAADLTDTVRDGMAYWDVPEGVWRVFVMTARYVTERTPPRYFLNPLLPESAQTLIDTVYRPHYEHFSASFGKTFMGFFSDEPALRAGRGYRAVLGEYPRLPVPWRPDMMALLGEAWRKALPGLWYEMGEESAQIRYRVMNLVSRLYSEHYSAPLGDWCRAHGVRYIGHVIEQNNAHTRLGSGAGHYFRAVGGQDMAGIDLVLHELRPEFRGGTHAWNSQVYEAEDDFFRFMLGQMAVSAACLDEKKQGRTLCEIFGAYGWQEDVGEMRYLANLMLSRGVNVFSPHAFTLAPYPDRDSPPHFDFAHQPLMPFISRLFGTMARVGGMIDGGRRLTRVAVLYNAESEWACGTSGSMPAQDVVKALNQRQLECTVVPMDALPGAAEQFDLLLIPQARAWPAKLAELAARLLRMGKKIGFIGPLPGLLPDGSGASAWPEGVFSLPLREAADVALREAPPPFRVPDEVPWVHAYPYEKDGETLLLMMNEDARQKTAFRVVAAEGTWYLADPERCVCHVPESHLNGGERIISMALEPGQLLILARTVRPPFPVVPFAPRPDGFAALAARWTVSLREIGHDAFRPCCETDALFNLTAPDRFPRFTGTVRYETRVNLPEGACQLRLGPCAGAAEAWLDGEKIGVRVAPPYQFDFPAVSGPHTLRVEITNTPVFAHRDPLSFCACIKPTGMLGPVTVGYLKKE